MKRVLVSWNAILNDFIYENNELVGVNQSGTHAQLYKLANDYDEHFLLNTAEGEKDDSRLLHLASFLAKQAKSKVVPKFMNIEDPASVAEIKKKTEEFLLGIKDSHIEIFISPGTPAMQTAWYLIGSEFNFDVRLFFVRPEKFRKNPDFIREYLKFSKSGFREATIIREQEHRSGSLKGSAAIILDSNKRPFELATLVADTDNVTALILGETGSGKEVIARHIHDHSARKKKKFLALNCSAFNDNLLESRLFGHEKGAFTHAVSTVKGAFQDAHGGTLFLDEIGDISPKMQQTLLRALDTGKVTKVGSQKEERVDVRVIAATHVDLWDAVQQGTFRADLFYRLAVAEIQTPSFRSFTTKDKKKVTLNLIKNIGRELFGRKSLALSDSAWGTLYHYPFNGNIRELIHLIKRWYTFHGDGSTIEPKDFPQRKGELREIMTLDDAEARHIQKVLKMFPHSKKQAYEALGITYNTLEKKIAKFGLNLGA